MEIRFKNYYLEKLYADLPITAKPRYSNEVIIKFRKKIVLLENIESSKDLKSYKGLNFEALKEHKKGLYSIRVDLKYRLEFSIEKDNIILQEIILIQDLSNHYK